MNEFANIQSSLRSSDVWPPGTQTLGRGLSIVHAVSNGARTLAELAPAIGCTRSTTQRLASALLQRGWLQVTPSGRLALGPQLTRLASEARPGGQLATVSRPTLMSIAERTRDAALLATRNEGRMLCLDGVESRRGLPSYPAIGDALPVAACSLGMALILDDTDDQIRRYHEALESSGPRLDTWLAQIQEGRTSGYIVDWVPGGAGARGISAPIRNEKGEIVASIGLCSAPAYLGANRIVILGPLVVKAAAEISHSLGWPPERLT